MESHHQPHSQMLIEIVQRQVGLLIETASWQQRLKRLFRDEGFSTGEVSVAVVGETEMHELNRDYLQHDYPTDVLSFVLDRHDEHLEGEIIVSADMAIQRAAEFAWQPENELGLYLIHGALHLAGYLDKAPQDTALMREREQHYLGLLGVGQVPRGRTRGACSS